MNVSAREVGLAAGHFKTFVADFERMTGTVNEMAVAMQSLDSISQSIGRQVTDIIRPIDGQLIARVTLGDEEDTRRAIDAAKRAFTTYGRSTPDERAKILRRLHEAAAARVDDLTSAMIEEYGGVAQFAGLIVQSGVNAFAAAEQALQEMPWTRRWDKTTVTLEPVGVAGLITAWNANATGTGPSNATRDSRAPAVSTVRFPPTACWMTGTSTFTAAPPSPWALTTIRFVFSTDVTT